MPRKTEFPDGAQLAHDVALVLRLGWKGALHPTTVKQVLKAACWWASDTAGKHDACLHWSVDAAERRASWLDCPRGGAWPSDHGIVHEHVAPRGRIEHDLFHIPDPTVQAVTYLLDFSMVCLVTEDEDRRFGEYHTKDSMPNGWTINDDKWARYELAKIDRHQGPHPADGA